MRARVLFSLFFPDDLNLALTDVTTNERRKMRETPHQKLLEGGFLTPVPLFCLICTISPNKTGILDWYQNPPQVLAARSFLVDGFDTHWVPRRF